MSFVENYGKVIVSFLVALLMWALNRYLKERARLQIATPHSFTFLVEQPIVGENKKIISPTQTVHTRSFYIINSGRETSTHIELVFNWRPQYFNIWPPRHFNEHNEKDGRYAIIFDSLAPKEAIGIELLSVNKELPALLIVRSDQCLAKEIKTQPTQVVGPFTRYAALFCIFLGIATSIYLIILLLQFLILKTPFNI